MNKDFFQQLFQVQHGYVYRYTGTVPEGQSVAHYITDVFAIAANTNLLNTVVVELPTYNTVVIYANSDNNLINSVEFELITDLIPEAATPLIEG
jgi:hypothetical protein